MIDCHLHALFGVDDGARTIEESIAMLHQCELHHIDTVYLTPHVNHPYQRTNRQGHIAAFLELKRRNPTSITLALWAEIYVGYQLPSLSWSEFTVHGNVLLLETSPHQSIPLLDHCFHLIQLGYRIVLAHVERYEWLTIQDCQILKEYGVLFQGNRRSFLDKKHPHHTRVMRLLHQGYLDIWASDAHDASRRCPLPLPNQPTLVELLARPF